MPGRKAPRAAERQGFAEMLSLYVTNSQEQQEDGKSYSAVHSIRGVLRPAFQMAVDDDIIMKNPFGFELASVVVNDSVRREAVSRDQMRKFLKFIHDDNIYCKYYEVA